MSKNASIIIPIYFFFHKVFFKNWIFEQWLRIHPNRLIFLAKHTITQKYYVFHIMYSPAQPFNLFQKLSQIPDNNLLLPEHSFHLGKIYLSLFSKTSTLQECIQDKGLSLQEIFQLGLDIANSLHAIHKTGFLHLDVSPDNIFRSEYGVFLLSDFSSCQSIHTELFSLIEFTQGYTAPECYQNQFTPFADQYSLGAVLYSLCNDGFPPFTDHNQNDFTKIKLLELQPELSEWIEPFFQQVLSPDPNARFSDLSSLQQSIQTIIDHLPDSNSYYIHLPKNTHPFLQTQTTPLTQKGKANLPSNKKVYLLKFAFILLSSLLFLLLISFYLISRNPSISKRIPPSYSSPVSSSSNQHNNITMLDISHSHAVSITESLDSSISPDQISILYAENNKLENLDELSAFSSLQELYLSKNKIKNTHYFQSLNQLKILILSDNPRIDLSGLSSLKALTFLDLSGNTHLRNMHSLYSLSKLKTLVLTDTNLSTSSILQLQNQLPNCQVIY